jgi:hypothetical protein
MVISEVLCLNDVLDPDREGAGMVRNLKAAAGYRFEETPHGVIVSKRRRVLIPWPNIRACVMAAEPEPVVKPAGRAGAKAPAGAAA